MPDLHLGFDGSRDTDLCLTDVLLTGGFADWIRLLSELNF